jgi:hypothetical protein
MSDINYQLLSVEEKKKMIDIILIYRFHQRDQIKYIEVIHGVH